MGAKADLHTHTICSDGALSPYELVKKAQAQGLSVVSITDHDSVAAIPDALEFGKEIGVEVISGVELSANFEDKEVHVLGYFVDYKSQRLLDYLTFFRHERIKRAERIVAKLNNLQLPLRIESVMEHAGTGSVGRPHIAAAMVDEGITKSYQESFDRYIGNGGPAYNENFSSLPRRQCSLSHRPADFPSLPIRAALPPTSCCSISSRLESMGLKSFIRRIHKSTSLITAE